MGMYHSAYWLSWFITSFINVSIIVSLTIFFNYLANYDMFLNTPFIILYSLYLIFGLNI